MKKLLPALLFLPFFSLQLRAQVWSTFTPQPGVNTLFDVYAPDANTAYAAGNNGFVQVWNGSTWTQMTTAVSAQRFAVWAANGSNIWAGGASTGNQLTYYNGTSWSNVTAATGWAGGSIRGIWGTAANNVWFSGSAASSPTRAQLVHYNGVAYTSRTAGLPADFAGLKIWGTDANNVWVVGTSGLNGVIAKWNVGASSWDQQVTSGYTGMRGIWGSASNNVWVVGGSGSAGNTGFILHWNGVSWTDRTPAGGVVTLNQISGSNANNMWAVGNAGTILKWDGTSWSSQPSGTTQALNGVAVGKTGTANRLWAVAFGDGTTSPMFTATISITLPVNWLSFTYKWQGSDIELNWATASETNNDYFVVEHQLQNGDWEALGRKEASGNELVQQQYQFIHRAPGNGRHQYRIKQVDNDGRFTYSNVISVSAGAGSALILNNPVRNKNLSLRLYNTQQIKVSDVSGRVWFDQRKNAGLISIPLSSCPAGIYFLSTENGVQRFILE
ncbi:MAG: hypothetical protein ABS85_00855 [Sphingobacteriales bacterium SCN 48-20]|uniref:T9SS type A sorting domain-containing protein n=1 Tax=Terrimonas ferruginea TaxID=249 RepID=UPI00086F5786|nr:T9SS type A sorting domain-containing protein [Terrimonas ferruginea]MBN8782123.1 T9SS type A sorting domain-containing protein [Terrimonas ferruginea]ODT95616.1 MAG: hypothetical protein ABS85_00855 [Sphingobacteriales bacterium SCN 48-20]OJW42665.1 MAG: hypothetical protein BGO56_11455 [Sphingobacteriales bacterium 48-107]